MKVALSWIKKYVKTALSIEKISEILTQTGLEVEKIEPFETVKGCFEGLLVGKIIDCVQHPNADRLKITKVDIGDNSPLTIVCGAENVGKNQNVIVATINATLYNIEGETLKIKKSKIRGEVSQGMICAEDEIGIGNSHDGILVLDLKYTPGTPASSVFENFQDTIFEIGLTPNRTDAMSHIGVARDLATVLDTALILPNIEKTESYLQNLIKNPIVNKTSKSIQLEVKDNNACPRFSGATIHNIKVQESPNWLKNHLLSIGLRPINNVVDLTNFVMQEWGIPLHTYDLNKIQGNTIKVGFLPENTPFITLDEKERKLSKDDIMVYTNNTKGLCMAGVFGGLDSGVTEKTTSIFIESAYWNPNFIRKTATKHGINTDASFRFERGCDPNQCFTSLTRFVQLLKEDLSELEISQVFDHYPTPIQPNKIALKWGQINQLIGIEIPKSEIIKILKNLEFVIQEENDEKIIVLCPTFRVDVTRPADVIEEILRIYGFNNIPLSNQLSSSYFAPFPRTYKNQIQYEKTLDLAASGWSEITTNSLENPVFAQETSWLPNNEQVILLNSNSLELSAMRQSMIFSGLAVISRNINYKQTDLRFFEFGKIYKKEDKQKYKEENKLCFWTTGNTQQAHWSVKEEKASFHTLKQFISTQILKHFKNKSISYEVALSKNTAYEYALKIKHNEFLLGTIGALNKSTLKSLEVSQSVFYAEIDWDYYLSQWNSSYTYAPISKYPEVTRDLSLVIDKKKTYQEILEIVSQHTVKFVKDIHVFDVHQGKGLKNSEKAYALRIILQDDSKTLNDKQINKTMTQFISLFEEKLDALIRQ